MPNIVFIYSFCSITILTKKYFYYENTIFHLENDSIGWVKESRCCCNIKRKANVLFIIVLKASHEYNFHIYIDSITYNEKSW